MALSEEVISRRLRAVDQTSESIQTTSMWILHHRDSVSQFVNCWTEVFKTAGDSLQIALFYVANDVCQKAKKKGDSHVLLQAFAPHWVNAISYSRSSETVQKAVSRILDIFEERQIYSKSQLADMRAAQHDNNEMEDNALLDYDVGYLIRDVEGYHKGNLVMERARDLLSRSDFNFKDKIKSRMKDRRDGEKFLGEIEQSYTKLADFFGALAKHRKRGQHLLGEIERAKRSFTLQLRDVTVVEDAYQKFGSGIDEVCTEIEEMLKSGVYPNASPPRDAPSPTANDDPFREGVETAYRQMRGPQNNVAAPLPLPKLTSIKEESVVTADSLQTNQSFKGSAHVLKMIEGIRGNEVSKANLASSVVSDPRLISHVPQPSLSTSMAAGEPNMPAKTSPFPLHSQLSTSDPLPPISSAPHIQTQMPHIPSPQLISPAPLSGVTSMQNTQMPPPSGSIPPWLLGPPPNFSTPPPGNASGTMVNHINSSGTTNSLQTPVVSSQLHDSRMASTTTVAVVPGSQQAPVCSSTRIAVPSQPATLPGMLPPPPPDIRPTLGTSLVNSFVPSTTPVYTGMRVTSFSSNSFTVPPPRLPNMNLASPDVMNCPPSSNYPINTDCPSPAGPLASRPFSIPSPSSSNSSITIPSNAVDLKKSSFNNGGNNNKMEQAKGNGDTRHESRRNSADYGLTNSRSDQQSFRGIRTGDRNDLRDPRGRERDREISGSNRGLQQQSYDNGGRRYSSDNHNRVSRYRDYDDSRRNRRYEPQRGDFRRIRR